MKSNTLDSVRHMLNDWDFKCYCLSHTDPGELLLVIPPNAAAEAVRELGGEKMV